MDFLTARIIVQGALRLWEKEPWMRPSLFEQYVFLVPLTPFVNLHSICPGRTKASANLTHWLVAQNMKLIMFKSSYRYVLKQRDFTGDGEGVVLGFCFAFL